MAAKIAIGCDHGGFKLKEFLKRHLAEKGHAVEDMGTHSEAGCDYPLIGYEVAKRVSRGKADRAILICKTGIGMAIIANKLRNVRSGVCNTVRQAKTSRLHNDTNVLSLAAKYINFKQAKRIVDTWLATEALGGRHGRRVKQIKALENKR
ncbi:MAG: ribose 5-phosphate isomerase B [Candidatus Omnitrophica bacterium]|nr:ribose 5-phosphate isomerase B [Candidatus Omnitrophota bacterium]